jgi:hypothetical protein
MMVNDKESYLVDVHLVHRLDVVLEHRFLNFVDVQQNLDVQNLDENLACHHVVLVGVHRLVMVDVVLVLSVVHLDELVLQVDVALMYRMYRMKMDCYQHVVDVEVMLVLVMLLVVKLGQQVLLV